MIMKTWRLYAFWIIGSIGICLSIFIENPELLAISALAFSFTILFHIEDHVKEEKKVSEK